MIISGQNHPISDETRKEMLRKAESSFGEFLTALGYDWEKDPNMFGTPKRIAKMFINETTQGSYNEPPKITVFPNNGKYTGIVFEGNIRVNSLCSHHLQPFIGRAYVAYIPKENGNIVGLSKLNRVVHWFAKRPQLQEQLTKQIHDYLSEILGDVLGVAVYIQAEHMCVRLRGVEDESEMQTAYMSGCFLDNKLNSRDEFYKMIDNTKK